MLVEECLWVEYCHILHNIREPDCKSPLHHWSASSLVVDCNRGVHRNQHMGWTSGHSAIRWKPSRCGHSCKVCNWGWRRGWFCSSHGIKWTQRLGTKFRLFTAVFGCGNRTLAKQLRAERNEDMQFFSELDQVQRGKRTERSVGILAPVAGDSIRATILGLRNSGSRTHPRQLGFISSLCFAIGANRFWVAHFPYIWKQLLRFGCSSI